VAAPAKGLQHARQLSLGLFPGAPGGVTGRAAPTVVSGRPKPLAMAGDAQRQLPIKG
jgi:hypothetical protein